MDTCDQHDIPDPQKRLEQHKQCYLHETCDHPKINELSKTSGRPGICEPLKVHIQRERGNMREIHDP